MKGNKTTNFNIFTSLKMRNSFFFSFVCIWMGSSFYFDFRFWNVLKGCHRLHAWKRENNNYRNQRSERHWKIWNQLSIFQGLLLLLFCVCVCFQWNWLKYPKKYSLIIHSRWKTIIFRWPGNAFLFLNVNTLNFMLDRPQLRTILFLPTTSSKVYLLLLYDIKNLSFYTDKLVRDLSATPE